MRPMLIHVAVIALAVGASTGSRADSVSDVQVAVDALRQQVVVTVADVRIPAATLYSHHPSEKHLPFEWPVEGWLRGYRFELLAADGRPLPREMLHHAGVSNLSRRQLPYPLVERLFAAGRETGPVRLPASMGVPMEAGQRLALYYALANPTQNPIEGVTLRISIDWTPAGAKRPKDVFPLYLDANPMTIGGTRAFDIPPGLSATSAQFTLPEAGWLRGVGAHLHDYAVEIRLEDVITGKVLARLKTRRQTDGRLISVGSTRFLLKRHGLRLAANRPYRVVGVYENPTSKAIPHGAMAFLAGPFIPDDPRRWPVIDDTDPIFQRDLSEMLGEDTHAGHHGGEAGQ